MKIITSGSSHLDIDAYACSVAYAELLNLQGDEAAAVSTAAPNNSIPPTVRSWGAPLSTSYIVSGGDKFVVVDVSEPQFLDRIVNLDQVVEVIDHHVGYEDFWRQRIGDKADIEFVGAACTQIYERWVGVGLLDKMSQLSARLLVCGLLDNTLNFGASITTKRDHEAYQALLVVADLPEGWPAQYFAECESEIADDPGGSLRNDTKQVKFKFHRSEITFGQLAVWDGQALLSSSEPKLKQVMADLGPHWMINLISISQGKSYLITSNLQIQQQLARLLDVAFGGDVATADRLWLRKEIIKQDFDSTNLE